MMWEGGGPTVEDLSGNGNTGTRNGTGTIWTPGKFGSAQQFNASDDYLDIAFSGAGIVAGQTQVTIVFCVNPTNSGDNKRLFDENTGTVGFTRLGLEHDSTTIQMKWRDANADPEGAATTLSTGTITNDVWQQIAGVYDSLNNSQKIYRNGVEVASASNATVAFGTSTSFGVRIGAGPNNANYFQGLLDHFLIYNRILSASEIALLSIEPFCGFRWTSIIELASYVAAVGGMPMLLKGQLMNSPLLQGRLIA